MIDPTGLHEGRMCNDKGVCIRKGKDGWVASDEATGKVITTEKTINDLLGNGKVLEAIVEILKALGYDMSDASIEYSSGDDNFIGSINFEVNGEKINMNVYRLPFLGEMGGHTEPKTSMIDCLPDRFVQVDLEIGFNLGASRLYHLVGHEMIHVMQYISGRFYQWERQWGTAFATYIAEEEAVMWNLEQLDVVSYNNAQKNWENYLVSVIEKVLEAYL
jgi:hypothetical protein